MNRYRERHEGGHPRQEDERYSHDRDDGYSPNFRQRGEHRRWNNGDDWRTDRDDHRPTSPYGVGADAAYGEPDYGRSQRSDYGRHERGDYARHDRDERDEWGRGPRYSESRPGTLRQVSGQTTEDAFWSPNYGPSNDDRLTGEDLRRYARSVDPEYENWREDQLREHDRDYHAWRSERRRAYDDEYTKWREERQSRFGQDFGDWRTQKSGQTAGAAGDNERRGLSASRVHEPDRSSKKQES
jgi:hypothetical protein